MKRFLCLLVLVATLSALLTGCLAQFECDLCGDEQFGMCYEAEVLGRTIEYCSDCKGELEKLENGLNDLGNGLSDLFGG